MADELGMWSSRCCSHPLLFAWRELDRCYPQAIRMDDLAERLNANRLSLVIRTLRDAGLVEMTPLGHRLTPDAKARTIRRARDLDAGLRALAWLRNDLPRIEAAERPA